MTQSRGALRLALVILLASGLLSTVIFPVLAEVAGAQEITSSTSVSTITAPANSPSPVGRAEPPAGQRAADTAIWIWLLAALAAVVVGGVITTRRNRSKPTD